MSAVVIPITPWRIARAMMSRISSSSASVGARSALPRIATRAWVSEKYEPKLIEMPCSSRVRK